MNVSALLGEPLLGVEPPLEVAPLLAVSTLDVAPPLDVATLMKSRGFPVVQVWARLRMGRMWSGYQGGGGGGLGGFLGGLC